MKCGSRSQYFAILAWCLERVSFWGHPRDVAGTALWTDHGDGLRSRPIMATACEAPFLLLAMVVAARWVPRVV
jgi:hypothetical protein